MNAPQPVVAATAPHRLSAAAAARLIAARKLSAEELARDCLARIAARDATVKAWCHLDPDRAIRLAREADRRIFADGPRGPLDGIPFGVKDIIDTADMPTEDNTPGHAGHRPARDASCVRILRAAGAYALGKAETVEYAALGGRVGPTRNPFDPTRTPGGSSSGSGAAVGDFQVPLAIGSQTGGSLIRPASFNGIYALKPTHAAVSWEGARHNAPYLDTLGWYGREPADLALVAEAMRLRGMATRAPETPAGLRVGVARTHNWDKCAPEAQAALERAARLLAEAGAEVRDLDLPAPFERLNWAQEVVMIGQAMASFLAEYVDAHADLRQGFREVVENAHGIDAAALLEAEDLAAACRPRFDALFADLDVIVTPAALGEAPEGLASTGDHVMNAIWTTLHVPCIAMPGHVGPHGLPVGVQIVGPRHGDARLLSIAEALAPVLDPALAGAG